MKKILIVCSMVILSLFCVGCTKTIELTDEESQLVAEYAAELLLKYDRNYDYKFYESIEDTVITTEEITEATTEVVPEDTTEDTEEVTTEVQEPDAEDTQEVVDVLDEEVIPAGDFDVAAFAEVENVSIKYNYYMLAESYPSYDHDGMYIEIEAPDGYQLLVVKFNIENLTGDKQYIDLYTKDLTYNIIVNDERTAKQMLTILIDDLYTYQADIEGDSLEEAVVLFQVSDSVAESIVDLKLQVTYGENKQIISLD